MSKILSLSDENLEKVAGGMPLNTICASGVASF